MVADIHEVELTELGRGVVVGLGQRCPPAWESAPRIVVDEAAIHNKATVDQLHRHWVARDPVVVELGIDSTRLASPQTVADSPHELAGNFEFLQERAAFLVWANNYDMRDGQLRWPLVSRTEHNGIQAGGPADALVGSQPIWIDGGPRQPLQMNFKSIHWESIAAGSNALARPPIDPSDELARDQLEAVAHLRGAARVIAPAGSGKTRVLVARLRHLIEDRHIERDSVTVVAYNVRARQELDERAGDLRANIRTIHSLGFWICRLAEPRVGVVEEGAQRTILGRFIDPPREYNTDPLARYLEALTRVRTGLVNPASLEETRDDIPGFAIAFAQYQQELRERGVIDFDDQIYRAIEHLLTDPELRSRVQATARHLLIDEFQDLTPGYLLLLRLVAAPEYQVFGVGDDDQVIYGFAGATPEYLIGYGDLFPGASHYALEINYRCPAEVVEGAANLLMHNRRRVPKAIRAEPDRRRKPGSLRIGMLDEDSAAVAIAKQIRKWLDHGAEPSDVAVLHRVNTGLLPVQAALARANIPYVSPLETTLLQRTGVRALLAWIRIATDTAAIPTDDVIDVLKRRSKRMSRDAVRRLAAGTVSSLEQLDQRASNLEVNRYRAIASDFVAEIRRLAREAKSGDTVSLIRAVRSTTGLDHSADKLDTSRNVEGGGGHGDTLDAIEQVARQHADPATFEEFLRTTLTAKQPRNAVLLSSVHRVKGREWEHVVVAGVRDEIMPHKLAEDMEEERRVFHVAITRAKQACFVVADRRRPSPFIEELEAPALPQAPFEQEVPGPKAVEQSNVRRPNRSRREAERVLQMIPTSPAVPMDLGAGTLQRVTDRVVFQAVSGKRFQIGGRAFIGAYADWIRRDRPENPRELGHLRDQRAAVFADIAASLLARTSAGLSSNRSGEQSQSLDSVADLAQQLFGIDIECYERRFRVGGWTYEGQVAVGCPTCGYEHLDIMRKPYETTQGKYRYWAVLCVQCAVARSPRAMNADTMKAIQKASE